VLPRSANERWRMVPAKGRYHRAPMRGSRSTSGRVRKTRSPGGAPAGRGPAAPEFRGRPERHGPCGDPAGLGPGRTAVAKRVWVSRLQVRVVASLQPPARKPPRTSERTGCLPRPRRAGGGGGGTEGGDPAGRSAARAQAPPCSCVDPSERATRQAPDQPRGGAARCNGRQPAGGATRTSTQWAHGGWWRAPKGHTVRVETAKCLPAQGLR